MKSGGFGAQSLFRAIDGFSYVWLEELTGLDELLAQLAALRAAEPGMGFLCTLDNIAQCQYTSGHASQDARLELIEDEDVDLDDAQAWHAWERRALAHRAAQLQNPVLQQDWEQVCGSLMVNAGDVEALLRFNRQPDALLDEFVYVQRLPVAEDVLIAGLPNGYFASDWDSFQNQAVIRRMGQHGYCFFGMGASWLGLVRDSAPDAAQAAAIVADLRALYGRGQAEVENHPGWAALAACLESRPTLMLGYTEDMAETGA